MNKKYFKLIELLIDKKIRELNQPKTNIVEFNGRTIATEALRELIDDILLSTEMLIDEKYGKLDSNEFKKIWHNMMSKYERQFANIIKNMITK